MRKPDELICEGELLSHGFVPNKRANTYSARVMAGGGKISAKQGYQISDIATKYGNGEILFNNIHSVDIMGIPLNNVNKVIEKLSEVDLQPGGTGRHIWPVISCQATVCTRSLLDSFDLGEKLQQLFCVRYQDLEFPNSFQISVSGCRKDCSRSKITDLGVVAYTKADKKNDDVKEICYKVYIGGTSGEKIQEGYSFNRVIVGEESLLSVIDRTVMFYRKLGHNKESLRELIERVGFERIEQEVFV